MAECKYPGISGISLRIRAWMATLSPTTGSPTAGLPRQSGVAPSSTSRSRSVVLSLSCSSRRVASPSADRARVSFSHAENHSDRASQVLPPPAPSLLPARSLSARSTALRTPRDASASLIEARHPAVPSPRPHGGGGGGPAGPSEKNFARGDAAVATAKRNSVVSLCPCVSGVMRNSRVPSAPRFCCIV